MGSSFLISAVAKRLEGKVALITGGLGAATAKLFLVHVVIADTNHHHLPGGGGDAASFVRCDVTNESDVQNAVEEAVSMHGKLDIMFNNAGIIGSVESDRVNVAGAFLGTKHAARVMKRARRGAIINTGSVCAVVGGVATHAYTSSKHAVLGLTRNTAVELGQYGIRVNCVSPYAFPSDMSRCLLSGAAMDDVKVNLAGDRLEAEYVAGAVLYLASDESRYHVSGHNLVVDGGFTAMNSAFTMFSRE